MIELESQVQLPLAHTKQCSLCLHEKSVHQFSLMKGTHSELRKTVCVECELKQRKARGYNLTIEQMNNGLRCPCVTCGAKSVKLDVNKPKKTILGTFCNRCWAFMKSSKTNDAGIELAIRMENYFLMKQRFPFLLIALSYGKISDPTLPLLDYIEKKNG